MTIAYLRSGYFQRKKHDIKTMRKAPEFCAHSTQKKTDSADTKSDVGRLTMYCCPSTERVVGEGIFHISSATMPMYTYVNTGSENGRTAHQQFFDTPDRGCAAQKAQLALYKHLPTTQRCTTSLPAEG